MDTGPDTREHAGYVYERWARCAEERRRHELDDAYQRGRAEVLALVANTPNPIRHCGGGVALREYPSDKRRDYDLYRCALCGAQIEVTVGILGVGELPTHPASVTCPWALAQAEPPTGEPS